MVQYSFTSTETRKLVRTDSPGWPPPLSHSSWTMSYWLSLLSHEKSKFIPPLPRPPYLGAHFYIFVILAEVAINFSVWTHYEFSLVFHAANTMSSGVATIVLTRWQCSFFDRLFLSFTTYRVESCQQQRRFSSCKHLSLVSFVQNSFKFFDS